MESFIEDESAKDRCGKPMMFSDDSNKKKVKESKILRNSITKSMR